MESNNGPIGERDLVGIQLPDFYKYVIDIMGDFQHSLHHSVKDVKGKRRLEVWNSTKKDDLHALVWIEIVRPEEDLDPYISTDVLRAMNDENVTTLFFFTNGFVDQQDKELLEGANHFVFSPREICESLLALDQRKSTRIVRKRKPVKVASAMIMIKNYIRTNSLKKRPVKLKMSAIPELCGQYTRLVRKVLEEIDRTEDINNISPELRDRFKKIQYTLLPELVKTSNYEFDPRFSYLRDLLFTLIEHTIIYIGNLIEFEAEEDMKRNRDMLEEIMNKLDEMDAEILTFSKDLMQVSEKVSKNLIKKAAIVIALGVLLLVALKFSK